MSHVTLLKLQTKDLKLGGDGSEKFLSWAVNHSYNGKQPRILREAPDDLKEVFEDEISTPKRMSKAIKALY